MSIQSVIKLLGFGCKYDDLHGANRTLHPHERELEERAMEILFMKNELNVFAGAFIEVIIRAFKATI